MVEQGKTIAGVDTHKDRHTLCLLDGNGSRIGTWDFTADAAGYDALAKRLGSPAECVAVGIEGTVSYGAGLARRLEELGFRVYEVLRPRREARMPGRGKTDAADAERAARRVLSGECAYEPKATSGWVEALRWLDASRELALRDSTAAANCMKALLVTAPEDLRARYSDMPAAQAAPLIAAAGPAADPLEGALMAALQAQARVWLGCKGLADELEARIAAIMRENAPALLQVNGCSAVTGAKLAIAAGENPGRLRGEAAFASLCGVAPVEASSGKVVRHRLNRGGDRQANRALDVIARSRMAWDGRTRDYVARRVSEGKSRREARRCLKRYIAREVYRALLNPKAARPQMGGALRAERLRLGLTQREVAEAVLSSPATISAVERGTRFLPAVEEKYAEYLGSLGGRPPALAERRFGGRPRGGRGIDAIEEKS